MAVDNDVLQLLANIGALKNGHFLLASGNHSAAYIEKFDLLRRPQAASHVCARIAEQFRNDAIDVVAGPTTGGVILAFEVARQLGIDAAYAERASSTGSEREFRRGTTFTNGARVLVVDDILTTGGSVNETLSALAMHPVNVVGVAVLVDRSGRQAALSAPLFALTTLDIATWNPAECPLCARDVPLVKPGTTTNTTSGWTTSTSLAQALTPSPSPVEPGEGSATGGSGVNDGTDHRDSA